MVGGPQLGYKYPGLTLEMDLSGPHIHVRGRDRAAVPGLHADRPRRPTSLDADLRGRGHHRHLRRAAVRRLAHEYVTGPCRPRTGWTPGRSPSGRRVRVVLTARSTGRSSATPVTRAAGLVALAQKRSSTGRETTDQIFYRRLSSGRVHSAQDFLRAAAATPQTFNSFYATRRRSRSSRPGACRSGRKGVNPDLPVDGGASSSGAAS